MGYSNFKHLKQVKKAFGLAEKSLELFPAPTVLPISDWLQKTLEIAYQMPLTNEKSRSERIVSPILMEIYGHFNKKIALFSGEALDVNSHDDLSGACDFFFALHEPKREMEAPVITLVEAKHESFDQGMAQCAAQMYASYLFNQQEGKDIQTIYGCVTIGEEWLFMKYVDKTIYIDYKPVSLSQVGTIVGMFCEILQGYLEGKIK